MKGWKEIHWCCAWQAAAINSPIDVYTMNERAILEFDSPSFGTVIFCVIGASQVGSCNVSAYEGDAIRKVTYFMLLARLSRLVNSTLGTP